MKTEPKRLLVVLQNMYDKGFLADRYTYANWRHEYLSSRTGVRLKTAIPDSFDVHWTNCSPEVGQGPDSVLPVQAHHLRHRVYISRPDIVLACGKIAEAAMTTIWKGPLVVIPHPAHRLLTNDLLNGCQRLLASWHLYRSISRRRRKPTVPIEKIAAKDSPRIAFRQLRSEYVIEPIRTKSKEG